MLVCKKSVRFGGVSALAIGAAMAFFPSAAEACTATPTVVGGVATSVSVSCVAGDTAAPYATSFTAWPIGLATVSYDGNGPDTITMTGGTISSVSSFPPPVFDANPEFFLDPSTGVIEMLDGIDVFNMSGGTIGSATDVIGLSLGAGADQFQMSGGEISGSIFGLGGGNTYVMSGGTIGGSIFAGSQDDNVTISGSAVIQVISSGGPDAVGLEDGNDVFTMTGGTLNGAVSGGAGDDALSISGGTIAGFVAGNDGVDQVSVSGGVIQGDISAETVTLTGGTIGGNITGLTGNTLVIDDSASAAPLVLLNGGVFSGANAVGTINNTNLAAGGTQLFTGFLSLLTQNSMLAFGPGSTNNINTLTLGPGSTLFVTGPSQLTGTLIANGSTISMINGVANDVFTLGGLALNGATIGVDVNQQTIQADQIVAGGFAAAGTNTILVNLLGAPNFAGVTDIPIILSANAPVAGTFVVAGAPATPGALFSFQLVQGAGGGLVLRATPVSAGVALAPHNAIDVASVDTALDALDGINDDAADFGLGLTGRSRGVFVTPSFGVFASGQFAEVDHDGFEISGDNIVATGPSFDASDFSAAISLDFNVAKHFGYDDKYGLNVGAFGGYTSTDVDMDGFESFASVGEASNEAGMFGGYGLFRQGLNYGLVSATAFLGQTDVTNDVLGTTGSYDTEGYAVTGSVGHIYAIGDRARFDLRGGLLGVWFEGSDFTDSGGNSYGKARISFGALKFEPGIYADYELENGMIFSPYARADIQQRFSYENTASIDGVRFAFDDADFSGALSTGFNLKVSQSTTLSAEVRGKASSDSTTLAGKIGLKVGF
ncbi:autotransporter [Arvimicrobium flavum]|uniref:autotransporter n=1 Tax=Arvimicrobium flavum TaxID=3393320 RepID=UPI00237BB3F1|nr:autotransporter [Mesorhizobium shangrilense]